LLHRNNIVASQLCDVADAQFTVEKAGTLNFSSLFKSITLYERLAAGVFSTFFPLSNPESTECLPYFYLFVELNDY